MRTSIPRAKAGCWCQKSRYAVRVGNTVVSRESAGPSVTSIVSSGDFPGSG